ncbi:hypothetical protein BC332_30303 [Capsicum chinense]|nr:hypothetical protein BC332_30303 [Capsicum chinense]
MTNSGENSVLPTHTEPVLNQPISTAPPSSIRQLVVHTSLVPSNTTSIDPDEYPSSKMKVEEDFVASQDLATAEADALTATKVLD